MSNIKEVASKVAKFNTSVKAKYDELNENIGEPTYKINTRLSAKLEANVLIRKATHIEILMEYMESPKNIQNDFDLVKDSLNAFLSILENKNEPHVMDLLTELFDLLSESLPIRSINFDMSKTEYGQMCYILALYETITKNF